MIKYGLIAAVAAILIPNVAEAQCAGGYCGYGYGYGRPGTYNYNVTGAWPGSGPYDSAIATTGIGAGASVINNIITSIISPPRTTVINSPAPTIVQGPTTVIGAGSTVVVPAPGATPGTTRVLSTGPVCSFAVVGYDTFGRAITMPVCQ